MIHFLIWAIAGFAYLLLVQRKLVACFSVIVGLVITIFVGFRFETGYDWHGYSLAFSEVASFSFANIASITEISEKYKYEWAYIFFNSIVKLFFGEYVYVQAISSTLLVWSSIKIFRRISPEYLMVFVIAYSWLFFSLYFSVVRQSLAISFFYLFLNYKHRKSEDFSNRLPIMSWVLAVTSIMFQYSSVIYFIIYMLASSGLVYKFRAGFIALSLIFLSLGLSGIDVVRPVLAGVVGGVSHLLPAVVSWKLDWYINGRVLSMDIVDYLLVALITIIGVFAAHFGRGFCCVSRIHKLIYSFVLLCIFGQVFFMEFEVFRNRIMYVGFPFLIAILLWIASEWRVRVVVYVASSIFCTAYLFAFLVSSSSIPFLPYKNFVLRHLINYNDDSRARLDDYIDAHSEN